MMRALITAPGNTATVSLVPIPEPAPGELVVRVHSIALNPVDVLYVSEPSHPLGRTIGSDFSGVVHALGRGVSHRKVGDRVAGFLHGACTENVLPGAFAEFLVVPSDLVFLIPDNLSFQQAAVFPLCLLTAAQALYLRLNVPPPISMLPGPGEEGNEWLRSTPRLSSACAKSILVYGGSTSVGQYVIQLALLSGLNVFVAASLRNHAFIAQELRARSCVDYHNTQWPALVRTEVAGRGVEPISLAVDCISEGMTTSQCAQTFGDRGGTCIVLRSQAWEKATVRPDVQVQYTAVWSMLGREFSYNHGTLFPYLQDDYNLAKAVYRWLSASNVLVEGVVKPNRVRELSGGLDAVVSEGFPLLGAGYVSQRSTVDEQGRLPLSAEKIVFTLNMNR